ncbi:hypothetical protein ABZ471_35195 [Streptomyces sp. NPDC005728]|uniref:hypothetical protein n=1 Tax=Streptomyces sp. NPDC005728 TaxID=3157054 RepID=UPI0033FF1982
MATHNFERLFARAGLRRVPGGPHRHTWINESRAWFVTTAGAAAESGDDRLHAWVLAREAMVPLNYGAPKAAADLAEQARRIADARPTATATLAPAVAIRAYALSHQPEQARAALTAADALMNRLPGSEQSDTWLTYSEKKHCVHVSHAYTTLADTRRARASQHRALELSKSTSTMTRTLLNIDAASCAHHDGGDEQACHRTVVALTGLPSGRSVTAAFDGTGGRRPPRETGARAARVVRGCSRWSCCRWAGARCGWAAG